VGGGRTWRKGFWRVDSVQIMCTYVCKWKIMRLLETISGMGGDGIKENNRGSKFNYDML
jgi:hypothetical protein